MLAADAKGFRWGLERRLEFIEFRLFWEGGVNRSDIVEEFGVSVPQASKDLSLYQEQAPENIRYDRSEKRYFASERFEPKFIDLDAAAYLERLMPSPLSDSYRRIKLAITATSSRGPDSLSRSAASQPTFSGHCWPACAVTAPLRSCISR